MLAGGTEENDDRMGKLMNSVAAIVASHFSPTVYARSQSFPAITLAKMVGTIWQVVAFAPLFTQEGSNWTSKGQN